MKRGLLNYQQMRSMWAQQLAYHLAEYTGDPEAHVNAATEAIEAASTGDGGRVIDLPDGTTTTAAELVDLFCLDAYLWGQS